MCSNSKSGCDWAGEFRSLDDHLTTCRYALLHCPNQCVNNKEVVQLLRHDLDHHLEECPNCQYQCPSCDTIGKYTDITTTHLGTCPKLKVSCPNAGCKILVPRCDLSDHQSICEFEEVSCKYAGIGCGKQPLCKDLEQHEKDDAFHLHLALERVNGLQGTVTEVQNTVNELQKEQKFHNVVTVFKFPEYHQHQSSQQTWYSPAFYTSPGGYRMCIRISVLDTSVSVFVHLMQGKNDDNLPWPFTGTVTITLLNQLGDENHHALTFSFPHADEAGRRVVGGGWWEGSQGIWISRIHLTRLT